MLSSAAELSQDGSEISSIPQASNNNHQHTQKSDDDDDDEDDEQSNSLSNSKHRRQKQGGSQTSSKKSNLQQQQQQQSAAASNKKTYSKKSDEASINPSSPTTTRRRSVSSGGGGAVRPLAIKMSTSKNPKILLKRQCIVCKQKLHQDLLAQHYSLHFGEAHGKCAVCGKANPSHSAYLAHVLSHLRESSLFVFKIRVELQKN